MKRKAGLQKKISTIFDGAPIPKDSQPSAPPSDVDSPAPDAEPSANPIITDVHVVESEPTTELSELEISEPQQDDDIDNFESLPEPPNELIYQEPTPITQERRKEQRLCCKEKIWFGYDWHLTSSQGQVVDISSGGAAFICSTGENPPNVGQGMLIRIRMPRNNIKRRDIGCHARICRVDSVNNSINRIAIQFDKPLPFKPVEKYTIQPEK